MGLLSLQRPAGPAYQNSTRSLADEAKRRGLISPELHAKLTSQVLDSSFLQETRDALAKAESAHTAAQQEAQDSAREGWSPLRNEDGREEAHANALPLRKAQDVAGKNEEMMRALLDAVGLQAKDQGPAAAIANAFSRWSSIGG